MTRVLLSVVAPVITACASTLTPPVSTPLRPAPVTVRDDLRLSQPPSLKSEGETTPPLNDAPPSGLALSPNSAAQNDNDLDGALSADDKCPSDVETRNGYQDDDGCPDNIPHDLLSALKAYKYRTTEAEELTGGDVASPKLQAKLKLVADVMRKYPDVRFEMIVHSDHEAEIKYSKTPTNQLGHALVRYLTKRKGIDSARLFSIGAGADMPLATNRNARGRSLNRRIEFALVVEY